jgi:hypothetical protein
MHLNTFIFYLEISCDELEIGMNVYDLMARERGLLIFCI